MIIRIGHHKVWQVHDDIIRCGPIILELEQVNWKSDPRGIMYKQFWIIDDIEREKNRTFSLDLRVPLTWKIRTINTHALRIETVYQPNSPWRRACWFCVRRINHAALHSVHCSTVALLLTLTWKNYWAVTMHVLNNTSPSVANRLMLWFNTRNHTFLWSSNKW